MKRIAAAFGIPAGLCLLIFLGFPAATPLLAQQCPQGYTLSGGKCIVNSAGGGTVTSVSVATANGISGTVATSTTTPAITLSATLAGDVTGASNANTVAKINGVALSGLATGPLCNTTTSGLPIICGSGGTANAIMAWGGSGANPTSPLSLLVTNQNAFNELWTLYNSTATTGVTQLYVKDGAAQGASTPQIVLGSSTLNAGGSIRANSGSFDFRDGSGTNLGVLNALRFRIFVSGSAVAQFTGDGNGTFDLGSLISLNWGSTNSYNSTKDTSFSRCAAGVACVGTGAQGSKAGRIAVDNSTPGASSDACTAQSIWADASFIYVCTASGVIKRATLNTF